MRLLRIVENLLFPPRCISCRGFLQRDVLDLCEGPLCDKCRLEWEREKGESCPDCGLEMALCRCYPSRMKEAGIAAAVKLICYHTDRETAGRRAILAMKKRLNTVSVGFFAAQLSYPIKRYMEDHGLSADAVAFCYVPRGRKNESVYGFDQSEQLCRRLSEICGARTVHLFYRKGRNGREQKKLTAKERVQNTSARFAVDLKALESLGSQTRCLFLVDDVITTGASFCGCVEALRPRFDGTLTAVVLARTPRRRRG